MNSDGPASILLESISDRYAVGSITVRYRFKQNASWGYRSARASAVHYVIRYIMFTLRFMFIVRQTSGFNSKVNSDGIDQSGQLRIFFFVRVCSI